MTSSDRDLDGRVCLVTGTTAGIGFVTAAELARRGAEVVVANRPGPRADAALERLRALVPGARIDGLSLDLGDLASVRAAADGFLRRGSPLHLLVNNAGLAAARGVTVDGFERTFGVNHLGHFLLTNLLVDRLRESAPARVVTVASRAHRRVSGIDFAALRSPTHTRTGVVEYGVSKLCNVLFSRELGRRLAGTGVTTYSLHPGVVATEIWRRLPAPVRWVMGKLMITAEEGAVTTLWCATAPELAKETGRYYTWTRSGPRPSTPTPAAQDDELAARLWDESERFVRGTGR